MELKNNIPKVSVVMPAYNSGKYIGEAIESILNQTFQDFELIIFSDGCTDNTVDVIRQYKDDRIILLQSEENKGIIYGLNHCIEIARGKYIAALDSDDISCPERLEKQVEYLDTHDNVALVGAHINIKRDGAIYENISLPFRTSGQIRFELFLSNGTIAHSSFMMRKKILDQYNVKYEIFKQVQDYHMLTCMCQYGDLACLEDVLVTYRVHAQQSTNIRAKRMRYDEFDRARCMYINELPLTEESKKILKKFVCRQLYGKKDCIAFQQALEQYIDWCGLNRDDEEDIRCIKCILRIGVASQRCNWSLLRYYLHSSYKDKGWLCTRLGIEFVIKCIIGYNKRWYDTTVDYMAGT